MKDQICVLSDAGIMLLKHKIFFFFFLHRVLEFNYAVFSSISKFFLFSLYIF
jgi:hypothetical protein